jgi:hypothetical protein
MAEDKAWNKNEVDPTMHHLPVVITSKWAC